MGRVEEDSESESSEHENAEGETLTRQQENTPQSVGKEEDPALGKQVWLKRRKERIIKWCKTSIKIWDCQCTCPRKRCLQAAASRNIITYEQNEIQK